MQKISAIGYSTGRGSRVFKLWRSQSSIRDYRQGCLWRAVDAIAEKQGRDPDIYLCPRQGGWCHGQGRVLGMEAAPSCFRSDLDPWAEYLFHFANPPGPLCDALMAAHFPVGNWYPHVRFQSALPPECHHDL